MSELVAELKLNLGSRNRKMPDFKNMDIDPHEGVDYVGDVSDLSRFNDNSVGEIYASHILEHFPHTKTLKVLKEWNRVLVNGGILYLAVPDFEAAIKVYHGFGLQDWIVTYLYGDQGYETAIHYAPFDEHRLRNILMSAGFSQASRVDKFQIGDEGDCSNNLLSIGGKKTDVRISLNMIVEK